MTARLRKCWEVRILPDFPGMKWEDGAERSDFIFAPSAGAARAAAVRSLDSDEPWRLLRARRAPDRDVVLPPRHYLADRLTPEELHLVVHAYGGTGRGAGYRDHFYTHAGDLQLLRLAWVEGLFDGPHGWPNDRGLDGNLDYGMFRLTKLGKQVAASVAEHYPSH